MSSSSEDRRALAARVSSARPRVSEQLPQQPTSPAPRQRAQALVAGAVDAISYYWHFVDVVWLVLFTTVCVL